MAACGRPIFRQMSPILVGASLLAMAASRTPHILKIVSHKKTRHKPGFLTDVELKR
ncbi:hypothetical protein D3C81_759060 [compost metagenome]